KEPWQIADAAGDRHLVAQRAEHVIASEQRKEIGERPQRGGARLRRRRERARQRTLQQRHRAAAIAGGLGRHCGRDNFRFSSAARPCSPWLGPPRWNSLASASLPSTTGSKPASRTRPAATLTASASFPAIGTASFGSGRFASLANIL